MRLHGRPVGIFTAFPKRASEDLVADARAKISIDKHWTAALGVENLGNDKYYLFHPFRRGLSRGN